MICVNIEKFAEFFFLSSFYFHVGSTTEWNLVGFLCQNKKLIFRKFWEKKLNELLVHPSWNFFLQTFIRNKLALFEIFFSLELKIKFSSKIIKSSPFLLEDLNTSGCQQWILLRRSKLAKKNSKNVYLVKWNFSSNSSSASRLLFDEFLHQREYSRFI